MENNFNKNDGVNGPIFVGIADIKIASSPWTLKTNLGSCVAVCLYSAKHKVGGMLHFMLADSAMELQVRRETIKKPKYADTGVPELLQELKKAYNVEAKDLTAKLFGGAKVLQHVTNNIGEANENAAREALQKLGIKVVAAKTGGLKGYNIEFLLDSGKVKCQVFREDILEY